MATTLSRLLNVVGTSYGKVSTSKSNYGIVYSVIIDETHPKIKDKENDLFDSRLIGAIEFRYSSDSVTPLTELPLAFPFDKNFVSLPTPNEIVEIIQTESGIVLYKRVGFEPTPNLNADENFISSYLRNDVQQVPYDKTSNYAKVNETTISESNTGNSEGTKGLGKYFKPEKIHKLKLYEGDLLIESRFGQSIRFSGYNNVKRQFSPTIIIRNSENETDRKKEITVPIEEDINKDGSSIVLSANQYQLPFQPGTVSDKGSSDFETKPNSFKGYPSKLIGDQLLLNSGRIILSAKNAEMIFYSKKNYGFISDGALSIDNKLGINANVNDNVIINTNNRDIRLLSGNGKIYLGKFGDVGNNGATIQKMVMGGELVQLLKDLISAITKQQYATPCGPTSTGPTNVAEFNLIKAKLNQILSNNNYLSR